MKKAILFIKLISLSLSAIAQPRTIKSEMEKLHQTYGVNFVYDSSIELNIPAPVMPATERASINQCLETLFTGTGIDYELMKKYIVLTKSDLKKKPKDYTIFIQEQRDTLNAASITSYIDRSHSATQTGLTSIDASKFKKGFAVLGSPDVIKEIQTLSGVSGGTELLSGMFVHGGEGHDNLFLLDGVPLYQVSHLAGLISSFNTEIIDDLDFYKSGFPARYGGKLSSVVDIRTRPGDMQEYHGVLNIGLLNCGLQFEGPIVKGKTSFNIAARRSWFDIVTIPFNLISSKTFEKKNRSTNLGYSMTDLNASITHIFKEDSRLSANFYYGADDFGYKKTELKKRNSSNGVHTGDNSYDLNLKWANILGSLNWEKKFSDDLHLNTSLHYVRSNTNIKLLYDYWSLTNYKNSDYYCSQYNISKLDNASAKANLDWIPSEYHHISAGTSFTEYIMNSERDLSSSRYVDNEETWTYNSITSAIYTTSEFTLYAADEISLTNWFKANVGLRYSLFNEQEATYNFVEPRAALRFQLGGKAAMKLSYTEMNQAIHTLSAHYVDLPMSCWFPSTKEIAPMKSRQVAGGVYVDLTDNISLTLEGYWKNMNNLYEYIGEDSIFPNLKNWEKELCEGKGRSYGAEMEVRWRSEKMDVAAYYTLSWTERYFENIWPTWYPARNDNRHKFNINATRKFSDKFEMYASWNFQSGNRMTVPTQTIDGELYYVGPYNHKLADYHRLDIGFNFRKTTKRGNESIWNLSIYNAYCRMNPLFYMVDTPLTFESEAGKTVLKQIAPIPILPSFNYTLKF